MSVLFAICVLALDIGYDTLLYISRS